MKKLKDALSQTSPTIIVAAVKQDSKLFSTPIHKADKEFLLNEAIRTGLSQKDIIQRAIEALKNGKQIPNAMPIKL